MSFPFLVAHSRQAYIIPHFDTIFLIFRPPPLKTIYVYLTEKCKSNYLAVEKIKWRVATEFHGISHRVYALPSFTNGTQQHETDDKGRRRSLLCHNVDTHVVSLPRHINSSLITVIRIYSYLRS